MSEAPSGAPPSADGASAAGGSPRLGRGAVRAAQTAFNAELEAVYRRSGGDPKRAGELLLDRLRREPALLETTLVVVAASAFDAFRKGRRSGL